MGTPISIKDFRIQLADIANQVIEERKSFTVFRHSRPAFTVQPYTVTDNIEEVDEKIDEPGWKTLIDFTEGGKKEGMPAKELLKAMKKFEKKYG